MNTVFHETHYGMFTGPEEAVWVRKMSTELEPDQLYPDMNLEGRIEYLALVGAEIGSFAAVFGVGAEVGDEEDGKVPVAVYYYLMADAGRTSLDPVFITPSRKGEEIIELPEWFPCQNQSGSTP